MTQKFLATLAKDPGSIPNTHMATPVPENPMFSSGFCGQRHKTFQAHWYHSYFDCLTMQKAIGPKCSFTL